MTTKNPKIYKFRDRMSNQIASLYVTLCLTCKQRLRPRVLFQGPPHTTTPTCKQTLRPRVLFQGPPPHNNTHLQTNTAAPCVVPTPPPPQQPPPANKDCGPVCCSKAPPHNNLQVVVEWFLQTKNGAPCVVLTLHC